METGPLSSSTNVGSADQQQAGAPVLPASAPPWPQGQQQPHSTAGGGSAPSHILELWSDGSRLDKENPTYAGAGVAHKDPSTGQWFRRAISLGVLDHIQDAELYGFYEALRRAEELLTQHQALRQVISQITVYTDCAVVGKTYSAERVYEFEAPKPGAWMMSEATDEKVDALDRRGVFVEAVKILGHSGIPGNVQADNAAKYGAAKAKEYRYFDQVRRFDLPTPAINSSITPSAPR